VIKLNYKYGYIDTDGKMIVEPVFDSAWSFSNGMGRILQNVTEKDSKLYGFVDHKGRLAIPPQYILAHDFREELAGFAVQKGEKLMMGFIDKSGQVAVTPTFSVVNSFSEGLAAAVKGAHSYIFEGNIYIDDEKSKNAKYLYTDKTGKTVIKGKFQSASDFSEGLARVEINNKSVFIDKTGKAVINTDFPEGSQISSFSEGLAAVNQMDGAKFINKSGKIVIRTDYSWADDFADGCARVKRISLLGQEKYGYVRTNGEFIWIPEK
jgi:hypothetical protein